MRRVVRLLAAAGMVLGACAGEDLGVSAQQTVMPDVAGERLDHAEALLDEAGFTDVDTDDVVEDRTVFSEGNWVVVSQTPAAGGTVSSRTEVVLGLAHEDDDLAAVPPPPLSSASDAEDWVRLVLSTGPLSGEVTGVDGETIDSLHYVEVTGSPGGYDALVQINAGDNFTANARREVLEREIGRAMAAVFRMEIGVQEMTVQAFFATIDDFGNAGETMVREATLDAATAAQANLDDPDLVNWPAVWIDQYVHPAW